MRRTWVGSTIGSGGVTGGRLLRERVPKNFEANVELILRLVRQRRNDGVEGRLWHWLHNGLRLFI